jgi:hypothetical protein
MKQCKCPLCDSLLSREKYEEVLRIAEVRDRELALAREDIAAQKAHLEQDRDLIASRAAEAERRKVEAEAAKEQKRLADELKRVQAESARMAKDKARQEKAAEAERQRVEKEAAARIARVEKDAERRLAKEIAIRLSDAKQEAARAHLRVIEDLKGELQKQDERHHREVEGLNRAITDLKQKAEAHNRSHFGPEGEEHLLAALKKAFPTDDITLIGKRGDIIHAIRENGQSFGVIVYECKNTSTWTLDYTRQLKKAMLHHRTGYGLLVSRTLPRKASGMVTENMVLVVEPHLAVEVATLLRDAIVELGRMRMSEYGKAAKTEELYRYLRSDEFSNAVRRIGDKIGDLENSLQREKSSHEGWWDAREQAYRTILRESSGINDRVKEILSTPRRPSEAKLDRQNGVITPIVAANGDPGDLGHDDGDANPEPSEATSKEQPGPRRFHGASTGSTDSLRA